MYLYKCFVALIVGFTCLIVTPASGHEVHTQACHAHCYTVTQAQFNRAAHRGYAGIRSVAGVRQKLLRMRHESRPGVRKAETTLWVQLVHAHNQRVRLYKFLHSYLYAAWSRVADCESGGWYVISGSGLYPDPVGIQRQNWEQFGGVPMAAGPVPVSERPMVVRIAERLINYYHAPIPDVGSCAAW